MIARLVLRSVLVLLGCFVVAGCGPRRPATYPVAGTVTVDGAALAEGHISFDPASGQGAAYSAEIHAGAFQLEMEPGPKRVQITASRASSRLGPDGKPDFEQYLPRRYNTQSELTADIAPQANQLKFELTLD